MKKILLILIAVFAFSASSNAQGLGGFLGKLVNKAAEQKVNKESATTEKNDALSGVQNLLGGVINAVAGQQKLTPEKIAGTWNFNGTACTLESDDALGEIGSVLITAKIEEILDEQLPKVGVQKGMASVTFDVNGTCTADIKGKKFVGNYLIAEDGKTVDFTFLLGQIKISSVVECGVNELNVTFDADKVLEIVKKIAGQASQQGGVATQQSSLTSVIGTLGALLEGYNGMRLGLKLVK